MLVVSKYVGGMGNISSKDWTLDLLHSLSLGKPYRIDMGDWVAQLLWAEGWRSAGVERPGSNPGEGVKMLI